jgi:hypothetical protein
MACKLPAKRPPEIAPATAAIPVGIADICRLDGDAATLDVTDVVVAGDCNFDL